jgi:hypothetical protein
MEKQDALNTIILSYHSSVLLTTTKGRLGEVSTGSKVLNQLCMILNFILLTMSNISAG